MNRRFAMSALAAFSLPLAVPSMAAPGLPEVHVFKSPYCGCCGAWVDHLKAAGFAVKVTEVGDTTAARKRLGMPDKFGSCHTATVAGYVLEGHVPADEVKRLLAEKPKAVGLAVPGMPPSSPGMDVPGRADPYDVFLIAQNGQESVYAHYPK
jgi:hypothetical protein